MTGEELKTILVRNGLQQKDIAEKLEMSQQNFAASLKVRDIKTGFLEQICDVLNVPINFFYNGTKYNSATIHVSATGTQSVATNSGDVVTLGTNSASENNITTQNNYGYNLSGEHKDNVTTLTETVATLTRELETSQQQKSDLIGVVSTSQKQIEQLTNIIDRLTQ